MTFNEFLAYGVDDTDDGGGMVWSPFELTVAEYEEVVAEVDSESRFDGLACEDGDWRNWFLAAVKRLRG
ncbi:MAG: hypothetical protein NXI31_12905 [bacterium]|nr:hypothetical protein [bacterium]